MKLKLAVFIFALVIFCFACGFPSQEQVKNDFRQANPTFEPVSAVVGEGHGDAAYYHIIYKKPGSDKTYEQVWLYLRQENGEIKVTNKEAEKAVD